MPKITYVHPDGQVDHLDLAVGMTVMNAAIAEGLDGIVAECGGNAMCATCHVYVAGGQDIELPSVGVAEDAMLDSTVSERTDESRLSCQLVATAAMDGLVVRMPEEQV